MALDRNLQEVVEWRGVEGLVAAKILTDDDTNGYTTGNVFAIAGVAEISRTTDSSNEAHYYDNLPMVVISSESADEVTINVSAIPMDVYAEITGQVYDNATGSLIEGPRDFNYFALGYKTRKTNGDEVYVWRYKGTFNIPDQTNTTENDSTDANGQEIVYTGIATTHKFTKTGKGAKAINVDVAKGYAVVDTFFDIVTTPDNLESTGAANGLTVTVTPAASVNNAVDVTVRGDMGGGYVLYRKVGNGIQAPAPGTQVNFSQYVFVSNAPSSPVKFTMTNAAVSVGQTIVAVLLDTSSSTVIASGSGVVTQFSGGNIQPTPGWGELSPLTVESEAGSATGFTKITWSGYNLGTTASLKYKIADDATPVLWDEELTDGWTLWNGESEIEATSDKVLTLAVVVTDTNKARAKGTAVVVANDNL